MGSSLKLKNAQNSEFTVTHEDNQGAISVSSTDLAKVAQDNLKNLSDGTLPTSDPLIAGRLWSNSGVVTVSAG
jgi:hypothetical protein